MNIIALLISSLISISTLAQMSLDINLKNNESGQKIELKKKIEIDLNETKTFSIPHSNKIVEIRMTENIPKIMASDYKAGEQFLVDLKILEAIGKTRTIISSPKIITLLGKEATMETFEDESQKKAIMSLKIKPTKI